MNIKITWNDLYQRWILTDYRSGREWGFESLKACRDWADFLENNQRSP